MQYQRQYYREKYYNHHEKVVNDETLAKDKRHEKISGVCAGLARHYSYPRWGIRLAAIFALFTFPMITLIAYIVAAIILPNR